MLAIGLYSSAQTVLSVKLKECDTFYIVVVLISARLVSR
jgi:hypothetical protein